MRLEFATQIEGVGGIGFLWARREPYRFIEARCLGVRGPQSQSVERTARCRHDIRQEPPPDPEAPIGLHDVEVAHPAHPPVGRVWIDIQPTHADDLAVEPRGDECLAGLVEAVGTASADPT